MTPHLRVLGPTVLSLLFAGRADNAVAVTIRVPEDASTIQSGIDLATTGDTVLVAAGIYTGAGNKDLELRKDIVLLAEQGPAATIIDCDGEGRGLYFNAGEGPSCRVEGFQIQNGFPGEDHEGGGMACISASPTIVDCEFRGNRTSGFAVAGGGIYVYSGSPVFEDCVISSNYASEGGGIEIREESDVTLRRCTISGNRSEDRGGGILVSYWSHLDLDRCIVWGNCAGGWGDEVVLSGSVDYADVYCCALGPAGVEGGNVTYDGEQIYEDPRFCVSIDCSAAPTLTGDFSLAANSPCLPADSPCGERIGARDVGCGDVHLGACCFSDRPCRIERPADCKAAGGIYAGNDLPCVPDPCLDLMGACCLDESTCLYISEEECLGTGGGHFRLGESCEPIPCGGLVLRVPDAFPTIQQALNAAFVGDTVLVAPGIWSGPENRALEFFGKPVVLRSEAGADLTVLDCESADRGLYFKSGEGADAEVRGFTIRNGGVTGSGKGAGIACVGGSSPTVRECIFENNTAAAGGGGMYVQASAPQFIDCVVSANTTADRGGGLWTHQAAPRFTGCRFVRNRADGAYGGGAVYDQESSAQFFGCEFSANEARDGAGIRTLISSPEFHNCVVSGNRALNNGGGLFFAASGEPTLVGCTVADNHARNGGGISGGPAGLTRTIVWGNCADVAGDQIVVNGNTIHFACCDVDSSGLAGNGTYDFDSSTLFEDPIFCAPRACEDAPIEAFDYGLASGSPCLPSFSPCGALIGASGESCADPLVSGACCLAEAACRTLYGTECLNQGGAYLGDGVSCAPNPCPGACCFANQECAFLSEANCYDEGGVCWRGGMSCDPLPCPMVFRVPHEFADIQSAVDDACPGATVLVSDGVYRSSVSEGNGNIDPAGKDLRVVSENGAASTIVEVDWYGRGFYFHSGESRSFLLQGFTIRGGFVNESAGGGILCTGASPTVVDCVIDDCEANGLVNGKGGGVGCTGGASPAFLRCSITRCSAYDDSGPTGGGVYVYNASPEFRQCEIRGNLGSGVGGAYIRSGSAGVFIDCVVAGNYGAGVRVEQSPSSILEGCTVSGNSYTGLHADSITVRRSIFRENCSWDVYSTRSITLSCSAVDTAGIGGAGDVIFEDGAVWADPLFCAPSPCDSSPTTEGDYTLQSGSLCLPLASPCGELIGALGVGCPVSSIDPPVLLPTRIQLNGPWPNPAGASARWVLDLPTSSRVRVRAIDVRGAVVARVLDDVLSAGSHPIEWPPGNRGDGRAISSGIYWLKVEAEEWEVSRAITVIR